MLTVKKSLNSSVVLVEQNGQEAVLFGKGIGYGKKPGDPIQHHEINQIFMPVDNLIVKQLIDSIDEIDEAYFELAQQVIQYASQQLGQKLNHRLYFALSDHLSFAVERHRKGIMITNRVVWEIQNFYPQEFAIGCYALQLVEQQLEVALPEQEAANIAFHLINAQNSSDETQANPMQCAQLVGKIATIVRHSIGGQMKTDDLHYSRFITHLKFFVQRLFQDQLLPADDESLYEQLRERYPEAMSGALNIARYVDEQYQIKISNQEITFLAVHIYRLMKVIQHDAETLG